MRQFNIFSARALLWAAVSLAVWWGSTAAFAQSSSFDFTFSGTGGVTASGAFDATPMPGDPGAFNINSISSGSVSGFPSGFNGSITELISPGFYVNSNQLYGYGTGLQYLTQMAFDVSGGTRDTLSLDTCLYMGSGVDNCTYELSTNESPYPYTYGTLSITAAPDPAGGPAPIPGAGLLSYLVLGFGGLLFFGRRAWGRADNALARLSFAPSARLFAPKRAPA
jgi:hypothetical protein